MVLDIKPVAYIFPVPVDWQGLSFEGVQDDERNQFFGEMIGAIIVRAVRDGNRQTIGVIIRPHQMVRGGLGR